MYLLVMAVVSSHHHRCRCALFPGLGHVSVINGVIKDGECYWVVLLHAGTELLVLVAEVRQWQEYRYACKSGVYTPPLFPFALVDYPLLTAWVYSSGT
jgi:hypothetical protein